MSEVVIDNDLLISLVEARPVLWDKSLDNFKDRDVTKNAWKEVCHEINNDFDELEEKESNAFSREVSKRWKNLRDAFVKAEKKSKEFKASGSKTKKRKYIFNEELQFLKKVYTERETVDCVDNEDNEKDKKHNHLEVPSINKEVYKTKVSKSPPKTRKHKELDETDLKILKALDKPQEQPNSQISFFQSLMPYLQNFNNDEMLKFQMGVLQLIFDIKNKHTT